MGTGKHINGDAITVEGHVEGRVEGGVEGHADGGSSLASPAFGAWRKSSRSGPSGTCVETASARDHVAVRDSKDRSGPVLGFSPGAWTRFVEEIKNGTYGV